MEVIQLPRTKLDLDRWDKTISRSVTGLPYALSWYLDAVTQKRWTALLSPDYKWIMPLPGYKYLLRQPPFCQQLGIFGSELSRGVVKDFLAPLSGKILLGSLPFNESNLSWLDGHQQFSRRVNYTLNLSQTYDHIRQQYHPSLRRQLNKHRKMLSIESHQKTREFIDFYLACNRDKFRLSSEKKRILVSLSEQIIRHSAGKIYSVWDESGNCCAMDLLWISERRIIHLFPASNVPGRKVGAMAFLLDELIRKHAGQNRILDFEGSVIPGIARFYRNFGAIESPYPLLRKAWIRPDQWKYSF